MKKLFDSAKKYITEKDFDYYQDYLQLRKMLYELIVEFKYELKNQNISLVEIADINTILKDFDSYVESIVKHSPDNENELENYLVERLKHLFGVEKFDINFEIKK